MSGMASQDLIDYQKEGMDQPENLPHQMPVASKEMIRNSPSKSNAKTQEQELPKLVEAFLPPPLDKSNKSERKVRASLVLSLEGQDASVLPYSLTVDVSEEAVQNLLNMTNAPRNQEINSSATTTMDYPNKETIETNLSEAVLTMVNAVLTPKKDTQNQVLQAKTQKSHKKDHSAKFYSQTHPSTGIEECKSVNIQTMITTTKDNERIVKSAMTLKNKPQHSEKKSEEPANQEKN